MSRPVLRFAPSPNGPLHLGHALSALLNDRTARRLGGTWLLRMEDIDPVRSRPEHEAGVRADLGWLGLRWPEPVRRQSEHLDAYRDAAARLRGGGLLYRCTCTRGEIAAAIRDRAGPGGEAWPRDPDGAPLYPGTCRRHGADPGRPGAWRLDTEAALARLGRLVGWTRFRPDGDSVTAVPADPSRWGDPVLVRKDVGTSYHLSVVTDDALQGVTHVVRGADLEAATDLHALLGALLGLPAPLYHHHGLVLDRDGAKLSKSAGSRSLADLRAEGATPADVRARLGFG